jgi:hypothetical protein
MALTSTNAGEQQRLWARAVYGMQGVSGPTCPGRGLSSASDRGQDADLRPELVELVLVVVVRPGLGDPAIPHMEHQHRWAADTAPVAFGVRAV